MLDKIQSITNNNYQILYLSVRYKKIIFCLFLSLAFYILIKSNLYNLIYNHITNNLVEGDENCFYGFEYLQKPYTLSIPAFLVSFIFKDPLITLRFTSLFFSLSTIGYVVIKVDKYFLPIFVVFFIFLLSAYPILYSATDDAALMFFLVVGLNEYFIEKKAFTGLIFLNLSLLTKDISVIYVFCLLILILVRFLIFKEKIKVNRYQLLIFIFTFIIAVSPFKYDIIYKDKGSYQAPGYKSGISWFNVRALSSIAAYSGQLDKHRLFPDQYQDAIDRLKISHVPNDNFEFLTMYPKVFLSDKVNKLKGVILYPHKNFGILIFLMFFYFLLFWRINTLVSKSYLLYLFLIIFSLFIVVAGYFERRWILAVEILLLTTLFNALAKSVKRLFFSYQEMFLLCIGGLNFLLILYLNRGL